MSPKIIDGEIFKNRHDLQAEEDIFVSVKSIDTAMFPFYNKRRNVSGWIDSSAIDFALSRKVGNKEQPIQADKFEEYGMKGFSLRLCIMSVTSTTASLTLALFPLAKDVMKAKAPDQDTKTSCPQVPLPIGSNNAKYAIVNLGIVEPASTKVGMGEEPVEELGEWHYVQQS